MGFVDLHTHVLPGLDDGAGDRAASMAMIAGLTKLGFDTVCATPHQKAGQFLPSAEAIAVAYQETQTAVRQAGVAVELRLAAENMWDSVFFERFSAGVIPSYPSGNSFLVEFPVQELPAGVLDHVFSLRAKGKLPVIAHPERYEPLWRTPAMTARLAAQCALVVDLGAVAGYHGRRQAKAARAMLKDGLAHAVASDSHSPEDVRTAAEGIAWIRKKLGEAAVTRLLDDNPRKILAGRHPDD